MLVDKRERKDSRKENGVLFLLNKIRCEQGKRAVMHTFFFTKIHDVIKFFSVNRFFPDFLGGQKHIEL